MRSMLLFNHDWLFYAGNVGDTTADDTFQSVTLPHTNKVFPHHNFDESEYQFISTYRKHFTLPEPLQGRRVYLDFDGAMIATTVTLNGHTFEEYRGGYTPFSFDITDILNESGDNLLTVHVDSTERKDIPPYGHVIDYLLFGGIYRDVWLRYVDPVHIHDVFARPVDVLSPSRKLEVDIRLHNQGISPASPMISVLLNSGIQQPDGTVAMIAEQSLTLTVPPGEMTTITLTLDGLGDIALWSPENPALYGLGVTLQLPDGGVDDYGAIPFGFRHAQFRDDGFYLNGERVQLRGLNRHQTYPFIGPAAPRRLQELDADIIKYELGCNIVRTSHYPQSPYFINRCDEIGLLVFEEIPGWQHIGDKDWQTLSLRDVQAMIERDRNHVSIILWGVRINESLDNTEFYTATNRLAHLLDPTRQTGGVRFWQQSEFLEDVYTFNDFSNDVREPEQTPHLITEFNGHMFPTKTFDGEERLMEHALRHARIQAKAAMTGGVSGAIGWCAFDYNTHQEFGSGDRICYHGVMDMFRLPKWAGYFYGSQVSPEERIVMQAATAWTMGDRSQGGNDPVMVFSNCDEVEVFIGEAVLGRYKPDVEHFPGLPHAPFTVPMKMQWGQAFHNLRIVGYYKGQPAAEQRFPINSQPHCLVLKADTDTLTADGMDTTRVVVKVVDLEGNTLRFSGKVVTFEMEGPADFYGENPFAVPGGQAAVFIRAQRQPGVVTLRARADRLDVAQIQITLV